MSHAFEVSSFKERFLDPISLEPLKDSVVLGCGHSFIFTDRLIEHLKIKRECPTCRTVVNQHVAKNYYANELYNEGMRLAEKCDRQANKIEDLQSKIILDSERTSLIEFNKNKEIKDRDNHISMLQNRITEIGHDYTNLQIDNYQLEEQNGILEKQIKTLKSENIQQEKKIKDLTEEKDSYIKKIDEITTINKNQIESIALNEKNNTKRLDELEKRNVVAYSHSSHSYSRKHKHYKKNKCPVETFANGVVGTAAAIKDCLEKTFPCIKNLTS